MPLPEDRDRSVRAPPVSIVTVTRNGFFFTRLLVQKIREFTTDRSYEIIIIDRGSTDGSKRWLKAQPDIRFMTYRQWWTRGHGHGEAAEYGARKARYDRIILVDSDTHPTRPDWLADTADALDEKNRLAGAVFVDRHRGNPHGWYIHPHYMAFLKADLGKLIVLRKMRGDDTDTGEEATIRALEAGVGIIRCPIEFAPAFSVGHPRVPTTAGGIFHAWYVSRLEHTEDEVVRETNGEVSRARYLDPLMDKLRTIYGLDY